jgi:hypothetical protein
VDGSAAGHGQRLLPFPRLVSSLKLISSLKELIARSTVPTKLRRRFIGLSSITSLVGAAVVAAVLFSCPPSHAGELNSERDEDVGLAFVGSARETGTLSPIPDVQIKAELGSRRILVRTNDQGVYKLVPNFGSNVPSDSVTISCAKDGYETVDVSRRQISSSSAHELIVAECLLAPKP